MDAVVFYRHSVFKFPSYFSFSKQLKLGKPIDSLKDGSFAFAPGSGVLQLRVSSTKSEGSRRGRSPPKSSAPGRTKKEDESNKDQPSDGKLPKSPNQEEIIALFRRIQSSISKGDSKRTKKRNANLSKEKSPTKSGLEALQQSRKQVKGTTTNREEDKMLTQKRGMPKKDQKTQNDLQHSAGFKLTRPPSNFMKRSPIPSSSAPRGKAIDFNNEASTATASSKELKLPRIEEMKLPELKELAKSRGIKGYSKLKKGEILDLLRS